MGVLQPPSRDQVIALAGLFQACSLVDTLARTGQVEPNALDTAITSLLEQNPRSCGLRSFSRVSKPLKNF